MISAVLRPLVGLLSIGVLGALVAGAAMLFQGGLADTVPVTVVSGRAGLVMYPDAKVQMLGITVGKVAAIEERPDGMAVLELAIDAGQLHNIPADATVDISATTVFGAKFVQFIPPERPAAPAITAGHVFDAGHVTVEINTVFQQLTQVLGRIEPEKLNQTLGAIAAATKGRGEQTGRMLTDLESFLAQLEPALPALDNDLALAPVVVDAYADSAPALVDIAGNAIRISQTVVEEQDNLDALLTGLIGLSDTGTQVLGDNRAALATTLRLLVPTTELTDAYNAALNCSVEGLATLNELPPARHEGVAISANFLFGTYPYRYPQDLPKVAASGGPQCSVLPVPYEGRPKFVVADVGANPFERGDRDVRLNADSLQQILFGVGPGGVR
ncbi:MCE family protein [Nocardia goodfellowii]|uniref:Virulence factor Mce-like protein n=1 Tax=Nocardia goodfellowii TaxID=882446 RepID=A0ABS4QK08_9NOCA|nr:MCE family protein [Nocardia goodfellowii]MBP2191908.1 virulence factor Mce-like protein [Nocardia goodfellowii]